MVVNVASFRFLEFRRFASGLQTAGGLSRSATANRLYRVGVAREAALLALHGLASGFFPPEEVLAWLRRESNSRVLESERQHPFATATDTEQGDPTLYVKIPPDVSSTTITSRNLEVAGDYERFEDFLHRWMKSLEEEELRRFESELLFDLDFDATDGAHAEGCLRSIVAAGELASAATEADLDTDFPLLEIMRPYGSYPSVTARFEKQKLTFDEAAALLSDAPFDDEIVKGLFASLTFGVMQDKLRVRLAQVSATADALDLFLNRDQNAGAVLSLVPPQIQGPLGLAGGTGSAWTACLWRTAPTDHRSLYRHAASIDALRARLSNLISPDWI